MSRTRTADEPRSDVRDPTLGRSVRRPSVGRRCAGGRNHDASGAIRRVRGPSPSTSAPVPSDAPNLIEKKIGGPSPTPIARSVRTPVPWSTTRMARSRRPDRTCAGAHDRRRSVDRRARPEATGSARPRMGRPRTPPSGRGQRMPPSATPAALALISPRWTGPVIGLDPAWAGTSTVCRGPGPVACDAQGIPAIRSPHLRPLGPSGWRPAPVEAHCSLRQPGEGARRGGRLKPETGTACWRAAPAIDPPARWEAHGPPCSWPGLVWSGLAWPGLAWPWPWPWPWGSVGWAAGGAGQVGVPCPGGGPVEGRKQAAIEPAPVSGP